MESLRVCHVIHDTHCGGTELTLFKVLRQLRHQHEFSVISLLACGHVGQELERLGVPVHSLKVRENGKTKPIRLLGAGKWLREWKPDVVQTWAYHSDLVGGLSAKLFTRAPVIWNVRHATLDPKIDSQNTMRSARLCGRLSGWVPDKIILNAYASMPTHQAVGYSADKMVIIPNGFDTTQFRPEPTARKEIRAELSISEDAPLIGLAGRFHPHKGQQQFIDVAKCLVQRHPDLQLIIAGPDCDRENGELRSWIETAGLGNATHLLGERADIHHVLNALDVYVMPSLTEGLPNVVGEAMACGIPVVATDVGDASRLLGEDQRLVPVQDVAAMVEEVDSYLVMSRDQREAIGRRNVERIEKNYSLVRCAEAYDQVWREALAQKRKGWLGSKSPGKSSVRVFRPTDAIREEPPEGVSGVATMAPANTAAYRPKLVHVTTVPMTQYFFLRGQLKYMSDHGFDVHCVSSPGDYMDRVQAREPVTTHAIPISRRIQLSADGTSVYRLWRKFRELRPEIVQVSTPKAALLGALAAALARVPVRIYQVRGLSSESETGWRCKVYQGFERLTARLCNAHLVNAKSLLEYAIDANILKTGLVAGQGMSNGVDLERFLPGKTERADLSPWSSTWGEHEGPTIGFVGRLTRDKGLEELHFAWRALRDDYPTARLLLVGPWEDENAVDPQVRSELQADDRVLLVGMQHDVAPLYKWMDVFAYPSHGTEGFPNAPMEAAAMQLPVVTTNVIGCSDAVRDGITGQIVAPRDKMALKSALQQYLDDPQLREEHGQAGRQRVGSAFVPESLWNEFREYYVHLLRREQQALPMVPPAEERRAA